MKLHKPAYAALTLAAICFANPFFNAFDILPDFIGAFIIAALLSRASDVVPFFHEARGAFLKLGFVSLARMPAALIMFSNLHTGMDIVPLFTLVFTVIELILIYGGVANAARGLFYLAERSNADGIIKPIRALGGNRPAEWVKGVLLVFLSARGALNLIPQFCHLTFTDERMQYISNRLYAPLEIVCLSLTFILGIFFAVVMIKYIHSVKRVGGVGDGIEAMAGEEKLERIAANIRIRGYLRALTFFGFSGILLADISLDSIDGFNALPHFIFIICAMLALLKLTECRKLRRAFLGVSLAAATSAAATFFLTLSFCERFDIRDLADNSIAREAYATVEIFALVETVLTLAAILLAAVIFKRFILANTVILPTDESYSESTRRYHAELIRGAYITLAILSLVVVLKCVTVILTASPISINSDTAVIYSSRLPWLPTVTFGISFLYFLRSIFYTRSLRDEVELKYDINVEHP